MLAGFCFIVAGILGAAGVDSRIAWVAVALGGVALALGGRI